MIMVGVDVADIHSFADRDVFAVDTRLAHRRRNKKRKKREKTQQGYEEKEGEGGKEKEKKT